MKYDGPGLDKLGDIKYKTARYSNGVAAHTLYLTVSHRQRTMDWTLVLNTRPAW